jgi:uroporphyrinogen decarboxylase
MQRAIDLAKSFGINVFHHDDGDCRTLLTRLAAMGIQVLNPIQWRCGSWDLNLLKSTYGDKLCFHGGVDNQQTLPFGTEDDVRVEVRRLAQTLGQNRTGLIIAPCHNLQSITPIGNIVALYDEASKI